MLMGYWSGQSINANTNGAHSTLLGAGKLLTIGSLDTNSSYRKNSTNEDVILWHCTEEQLQLLIKNDAFTLLPFGVICPVHHFW
ncbi:hypothetical protein EB796_019784 [Bugula neritina]|uniref:Uncharacterized protein n=1 Tax=Bugula neritina TaxID=10212 RepID=A0A7J7J7J4_BUGNE|nr:hypothetical protein EB796_019784 [Bugula neritina]